MIKLYFPIQPVAKARARVTRRGFAYTPKKTKDFEETLKYLATLQLHSVRHEPLTGPLSIEAYFYLKAPKKPKSHLPITKPDHDNLIKSVCDAMNGIAWVDDAQICESKVCKRYAQDKPSIVLHVKELL